jgi:hypothetical protein
MPPRTLLTGNLAVELVKVPIRLYLAQVAGDDSFFTHLVHTPVVPPGGAPRMLRKQVVPKRSSESASFEGEISIADVATVQVTSEELDYPIDDASDHK